MDCVLSIFLLQVYSIAAVFARVVVLPTILSLKCPGIGYDGEFFALDALTVLIADVASARHTGNVSSAQK